MYVTLKARIDKLYMYVCMYICMYVTLKARIDKLYMYVCMYVRMLP